MNTYKIIAEGTRTGQWLAEMWDAESEKEARERFLAVHKGRYTITSSELVYTDVPERGAREQAGREQRSETLLTYVCDEVCRHRVPGRSQEELDDICAACSLETLAKGAAANWPLPTAATAEQAGNAGKGPEPLRGNREGASLQMKLQAMRLALSLTFERTLKSDLFLWAAQRGRDDFFFLLDGNTGMMAESVLGLYQQILKTGGKERQKVTRKGIQYDGKWYFSHELAMHLGEEVLVRPEGKYLTVSGTGGEIIEGFPF